MTAQFKPRNFLESVRMNARREAEDAPRELRVIETKDQSGRVITTFEGSPKMWMRDFASPSRWVVGIKTKF
jgi:hypothetical protein